MYEQREVDLDQLLLDPNNFRVQDTENYVVAEESRFGDATVQDRAYRRLRPEGLAELKKSILTNGFLPIERLVVRPYNRIPAGISDDTTEASSNEPRETVQRYLVLEGNRRVAALRWIREDHEAGVPVPSTVLEVLSRVPVVDVGPDVDESTHMALMGIRHVGGIKQWDGYQRAKLVTELRDNHDLQSSEVADRLGMTVNEVNRRYRAYKALDQMRSDEVFGDAARSSMYPIFHEAVSLPQVRTWLGWDEGAAEFLNESERHDFYGLITEREMADGDESTAVIPPKITSYSQVRELRSILGNADAFEALLDPGRSWGDALGLAKAEDLSRSWRKQVAEAVASISSIGVVQLEEMPSEDLDVIRRVRDVAGKLLSTYDKLTG